MSKMTTPFKAFNRPDAMLRKYAHFEDPAPVVPPPPDPAPQTVTFTPEQQEAINKLIGKARTEGKQAGLTDFLKRVGAEKPEDVETGYKAHVQKVEGEKTEAQKAIDAAAKDKERADKAEKALADRNAEIEAEKREATRDSAIKTALTTANAKAEKVLKLLKVDSPDALAAVLKEDGSVDETKVKAVVEAARKAYPEDFGKGGVGSPTLTGGGIPQGTPPKVVTSGRL